MPITNQSTNHEILPVDDITLRRLFSEGAVRRLTLVRTAPYPVALHRAVDDN